MLVHKIIVGPLQANCYLLADPQTKECLIIDPGDELEKIIGAIKENNLIPKAIMLTHGHPDHVGAVEEIARVFQIKTVKNHSCVEVIKTPGHTSDSVCLVAENDIFTGDTLFKNSIGRTDLPGGDEIQMRASLKRLMELPDNYKIFPGHGPETTIGEEKQNNPFL